MHKLDTYYIGGQWVAPAPGGQLHEMVCPVTETVTGTVHLGTQADVERAVAAARAAWPAWSATSVASRVALLTRIIECYTARYEELAGAVSTEIGAPVKLSHELQVRVGLAQLQSARAALESFEFAERRGTTEIVREAVGVVALITPWNWPLNQIAAKVAPALAAGCTIVLKPSEIAPLDARLFTEILHEAGVPPGVFNLVYGDGATVGAALSSHPDVDMVSITGSTRAGAQVATNAAGTVKRVAQELGGKSPNLVFDDADLPTAVKASVLACMLNSGQTCIAPTRLLVQRKHYEAAVEVACATANALKVGDPAAPDTILGPISNRAQYEKVQHMIAVGVEEGARLVAGGPGRPAHLSRGFFARPTVFADVRNDMAIAREEIFGPVLAILPFDTEEEAIAIANDTPYGLAAYVWSGDAARARRVAARLRAGSVQINGAKMDLAAPFGGMKASGNGREHGAFGLAEFLEYKQITGCAQ
ncbi:3-succinoylsemialdehyde-pyridine dehydrogenase [Paraburkholderia unamae]|uniref:aldehyde dehydrogenase family protein n=1 Tax=Paraburkholderia unamae TaxID=219649 RepID=UPI001CB457F6|nr:aldehyde dehydrogenase family protein [Paraburkholderia unamae]CAG9274327.1 3-succinoylsemialdehyde-pyridine dehydrogenase [Paraburkholderia unamae]